MKAIILLILTISLSHQFTIGQWILQTNPVTSGLYDIDFIDLNTGWITGTNSIIINTSNGGMNWIQQLSPISGVELNSIQMINSNTGYIAGWDNTLVKTTNAGLNWIQVSVPQGQYNALCFINEQTGWLCSFLGVIRRTTNGGLSWDSLNTESGGPLRDIQFLNNLTGWVVGDGGYIRKTTNGGTNWFFQFFGTSADFWYNSLYFIDINTGWVVARNSRIFRTTNGGNKWDTVSLINGGQVIKFSNFMTGWCGGSHIGSNQSVMYKTTNSGLNWIEQDIPAIFGFCGSLEIQNDSNVWTTFGNKILHTSNGGTYVSIQPTSNNIPVEYKLFQNYPNPFNPNTNIEFAIPAEDAVKLIVYDILGREVRKLLDKKLNSGKYKIVFNGENLSSGVYFYILYYTKGKIAKKMIINE